MKTSVKHGMTDSPEYKSWAMMLSRCRNANDPGFPRYGGRGITVDPRWEDFAAFYQDMGPRPAGTSIDRIDPDGDYEPGNCRWADNNLQGQNKRKLHGSSQFTGAQFARDKWRAYINKNKKQYGLGLYDREEDAALAYDLAAMVIYPGGKLNFPARLPLYGLVLTLTGISDRDFESEPFKSIYAAVRVVQNLADNAFDIEDAIDSLLRWREMRREDSIQVGREGE